MTPITSEIAEYIRAALPVFFVKNTHHSYGYACAFCLDYKQIEFKFKTAYQNVNGVIFFANPLCGSKRTIEQLYQ